MVFQHWTLKSLSVIYIFDKTSVKRTIILLMFIIHFYWSYNNIIITYVKMYVKVDATLSFPHLYTDSIRRNCPILIRSTKIIVKNRCVISADAGCFQSKWGKFFPVDSEIKRLFLSEKLNKLEIFNKKTKIDNGYTILRNMYTCYIYTVLNMLMVYTFY